MSAETTGFGHVLLGRPQRLDRRGILTFLRSIAEDRSTMLELRRLLAEELSRSAIFRLRDDAVLEQLADRYLHGSLSLSIVRPFDVKLEGFTVEGEATSVLKDQENKADESKPTPEIPPEYPALARSESDQIISSTSKLNAKLDALLFSSFGFNKRRSTIGRELVLMAEEQSFSTNKMRNGMDVVLALQLHPPGEASKPTPQVKDAYVAAAAEIAAGAPRSASVIGELLLPLSRVDKMRKVRSDERNDESKTNSSEDVSKAAEEKTFVEVELLDDGDPPQPVPNARFRVVFDDGQVFEGTTDSSGKGRVDGVPLGKATITFPDIDAKSWAPR